jgi:hypothetical protein
MAALQNCLLAQFQRCQKNFILEISHICLRENFPVASVLSKKSNFTRYPYEILIEAKLLVNIQFFLLNVEYLFINDKILQAGEG